VEGNPYPVGHRTVILFSVQGAIPTIWAARCIVTPGDLIFVQVKHDDPVFSGVILSSISTFSVGVGGSFWMIFIPDLARLSLL
jgi:hypothetical protein